MLVLGISGSPRPKGNTAYAVRRALEVIAGEGFETEYISLAGKDIGFCTGCWGCRATHTCVFDDDMIPVYEAIRRCDGLLLGSPVYMGMVSGQLKAMMDRTVVFRVGGDFELRGKVGAGIACGGFRNGGQELVLQSIHTFLLQQDMFAIADGPPFSHSGAAITGMAERDELGLRTVDNVARRLAQAVKRCGESRSQG
jgi:multimeric flavodoxin WrbA